MIFPILSAILGILAFLPFDYFWPFGFFYLVPLFIFFAKENKFWRLIGGALIFRIILLLGTVYYTLELIAWTQSIGIFLGLPISVYFIKRGFMRIKLIYTDINKIIFIIPFFWTFFDHLQARFSLLPTYIITAGNIFGSSPFVGLSSFGGLIFLTFFTATINALIAAAHKNFATINRSKIFLMIIAIIFLSWRISNYQLRENSIYYNDLKNSLKIAAVSVNKEFNQQDFKQLALELLTGEKIDLIIFPEDIMNNSVNISFYQNFAEELKTNLIAAFDTYQDDKKYNSAVLFNEKGYFADVHNKNRLTFIGEYWPFGSWRPFFFDWLKKTNPEIKDYVVFNPKNFYSIGEKKLLDVNINSTEKIKFAALICLEIHYPEDLKKYKNMGAKFIVNPTSNRWLDLGTKHFLYLTNNLRKIESVWLKIPIISSGVKDYAGIIIPNGKIQSVNFENIANNKNYDIFIGEIKI